MHVCISIGVASGRAGRAFALPIISISRQFSALYWRAGANSFSIRRYTNVNEHALAFNERGTTSFIV